MQQVSQVDSAVPEPVRQARRKFTRCTARFALLAMLLVLPVIGLLRWGVEYRARRAERKLVEQQLAPFGVTPRYWQGHVVQLSFSGSAFRPDILTWLGEFPELKRLVFIGVSLSPQDLKRIARVPQLKQLVFMNIPIDDADCEHLAECTALESLHFSGTDIRGDGLQHLAPLQHLSRLDLRHNQLDRRALEPLKQLKQLATLNLAEPGLSEDDRKLLTLALPQTRIR